MWFHLRQDRKACKTRLWCEKSGQWLLVPTPPFLTLLIPSTGLALITPMECPGLSSFKAYGPGRVQRQLSVCMRQIGWGPNETSGRDRHPSSRRSSARGGLLPKRSPHHVPPGKILFTCLLYGLLMLNPLPRVSSLKMAHHFECLVPLGLALLS